MIRTGDCKNRLAPRPKDKSKGSGARAAADKKTGAERGVRTFTAYPWTSPWARPLC